MTCPTFTFPSMSMFTMLVAAVVSLGGCSRQEAAKELKEAEAAVEEAATAVVKDAEGVVEEGVKMASELGDKAQAYLAPLMQKFSSLEELKDTPEKLKTAVVELIESIEQKTEDIKLPETVSDTLGKVKEKLIALRDYLEGEFEQSKIDGYVKEVMESVKSGLGVTNK